MTTVDEYLETVTLTQKDALQRVRNIIKQTVPETSEKISYKMPAFTYKGKTLILMSAFKNHMSLFGAVESVEDKLEGKFNLSHRGTVQFTADNPIPEDILKELLINRRNEIDADKGE